MSSRVDYSCKNALDDIEIFVKANIRDKSTPDELLDHLDECRTANRVDFRYIHERLMKYRKGFSDYFPFSEDEKEMIDGLFYFCG